MRGLLGKVWGKRKTVNMTPADYLQADYFAAWPVIRKLAVLINLQSPVNFPDEENLERFKSMIKPFPPELVRKYF